MRTFVSELKKQLPPKESSGFRVFKAIKAGKYSLSIQGSDGHYCTPRQIMPPEGYISMEVAIFNKRKEWFHTSRSRTIRQFPRYAELRERADGSSKITVFGYVPVDLIEDLYLYLKNV